MCPNKDPKETQMCKQINMIFLWLDLFLFFAGENTYIYVFIEKKIVMDVYMFVHV